MLSPLDDRYREKVKKLNECFGETNQLILKTKIEIDYFIALCEELELKINEGERKMISFIYEDIKNIEQISSLKAKETETKHDIKAIEYYLRERFKNFTIPHEHMIHFGLTSQDINSLATSISLDRFNQTEMSFLMNEIINAIFNFGWQNKGIFPARTHGQLAVPTLFEKEMNVFVSRLDRVWSETMEHVFEAKFGGAVGNLSAHNIAYPEHRWNLFMAKFLRKYDIDLEKNTTQVSGNVSISKYFDNIRMINNILIDLCRDIWMYNSYGYFTQAVTEKEVGSSTMPQKVNPILFENAEGNLELANCLLSFMSNKLQTSRMQRDLTDTTVVRNIGVALGHSVVAYKSLLVGLGTLSVNRTAVDRELSNTGLLAEAYQIILKKENVKDGYELIKDMERHGQKIDDLNVSQELKNKLKSITVNDYVNHIRDTI
jgi:adenylosuccinate lyase